MAFNHGHVSSTLPPPSTANAINPVNSSYLHINPSTVHPQSGSVPYVPSGHGTATQNTTAQMAQLSLATVQHQQHALANQPNGNVFTGQPPMSMHVIQQAMSPPSSPESVSIMYTMAPVHVDANHSVIGQQSYQTSTVLAHQPSAGMVANSFTSGMPINMSAPLLLHRVPPSQHPIQSQSPLQQHPHHHPQDQPQVFGHNQHVAIQQPQPPQHLPLSVTTCVPNHIQINQNVPGLVEGTQPISPDHSFNKTSPDRQTGKTQLNALPHSMPTVLNPSLQMRRASASGDLISPQSGADYQFWDPNTGVRRASALDGLNPNRSGYLHRSPDQAAMLFQDPVPVSPISPSEQVSPVYEIPADKEVCLRCYKKVYVVERIGPIKEAVYHKNCFTCAACKTKLTMKTFHHNPDDMHDVNVYCMSHKPKTRNIGSEANAYYLNSDTKESQLSQVVGQDMAIVKTGDHLLTVYNTTEQNPHIVIGDVGCAEPTAVSISGNVSSKESVQEISANTPFVESPQTPPHRRQSHPSTGGSSPFSSLSSSSSLAAAMKTDSQNETSSVVDPTDNGYGVSLVRCDRPSSRTPSVTSLELLSKPETAAARSHNNGTGNEIPIKTSLNQSNSLERQDRPSSNVILGDSKEGGFIQRDPASRMIKSHSTHGFPTSLANQDDQHRDVPQQKNRRSDRPSQYQ